jgi:predicted Zn-dependent protease
MSREDQEKLGLQAVAEVYKQMPVLPDSSPITQYVQQLGKRLEKQIPSQYSWPYQFHVIQQKEINAFALPGGPIFINVGTINAAANEAQLAGVMSHEMSHVYMQHSAKQQTSAAHTLTEILGAAAGMLGGSALGNLARVGIQFGAGTVLMKYSRADEAQADSVGAIIMYKAGYNPMELANFFEVLAEQGGAPPQFLSDHPQPGQSVSRHRKRNSLLAAAEVSQRHSVFRQRQEAGRWRQVL